jgi:hypothetical protein
VSQGVTRVLQGCYRTLTRQACKSQKGRHEAPVGTGTDERGTCVTVVLQWCYSGVTVVLQWCYSSVTVVLQWCYSCVTVVLQWCYSGDTVVTQLQSDGYGVRD